MVSGDKLCAAIDKIEGFSPFLVGDSDYLFSFVEGVNVPTMVEKQYEFAYEDVIGTFGRTFRSSLTSSLICLIFQI